MRRITPRDGVAMAAIAVAVAVSAGLLMADLSDSHQRAALLFVALTFGVASLIGYRRRRR
jgi:hypothetical protein